MKTFENYESWAMENAKEGASIVSYKPTNTLTASANYYNRKIETQRIVIVEGSITEPIAVAATKITFLNAPTKERNERS
jgi:hypothetical protein